ncbi:hypothetical protein Btru_042479 [Bulinus truncatus]|nr:hypothetical protein Btru_042479 [Bulinus truncatus]
MIILQYVLIICLYGRNVLSVSDISGKEFVLSFPTYHTVSRNVSFLMYTLEVLIKVKVGLTVRFGSGDVMSERIRLDENVQLNRNDMKVITYWENYTYGKGQYRYGLPRSDVSEKFSYVLKGSHRFYLTVFIIDVNKRGNSFAALQAIPVSGWGFIYYAVVTSQETIVKINLKSPNSNLYLTYDGMVYMNKAIMIIELQAYQSFSLQACPRSEFNDYGELTGTRLEGSKHIGVISGNCGGYLDEKCSLKSAVTENTFKAELAMEMLLPDETFGTVFILLNPPGNTSFSSSTYIVLAAFDNTTVGWRYETHKFRKEIKFAGDSIKVYGKMFAQSLNSTMPVAVYLVYNTECSHAMSYGDASIVTIIPSGLFMDIYVWITQDVTEYFNEVKHYVAYVVLKDDVIDGLQLDGAPLNEDLSLDYSRFSRISWYVDLWEAGELPVRHGYHEMFSTRSAKFGLYIFGIGRDTYMYPAGFMSSVIYDTECKKGSGQIYLIDEDCDGWIDEEKQDNNDNDGDGLIDEDLMPPPPKNGSWGEWEPWWCTSCKSTLRTRYRQCINPMPVRGGQNCAGISEEVTIEECQSVCNMDCPDGKWGLNCTSDCSQCESPCDKKKGICHSCKPGYRLPLFSCSKTRCQYFVHGPMSVFRPQPDVSISSTARCQYFVNGPMSVFCPQPDVSISSTARCQYFVNGPMSVFCPRPDVSISSTARCQYFVNGPMSVFCPRPDVSISSTARCQYFVNGPMSVFCPRPELSILSTSRCQCFVHGPMSVFCPRPDVSILSTARCQYFVHGPMSVFRQRPDVSVLSTARCQYFVHGPMSVFRQRPDVSVLSTARCQYFVHGPMSVFRQRPDVSVLSTARAQYFVHVPMSVFCPRPDVSILSTSRCQCFVHGPMSVFCPRPDVSILSTARCQCFVHGPMSVFCPRPDVSVLSTARCQYFVHGPMSVFCPRPDVSISDLPVGSCRKSSSYS